MSGTQSSCTTAQGQDTCTLLPVRISEQGEQVEGKSDQVGKLALVVAAEELESAAAIAGARHVRVHRDAHDARPRQRCKLAVLELLAHRPRNHVTLHGSPLSFNEPFVLEMGHLLRECELLGPE